jgi:hypothetical protein
MCKDCDTFWSQKRPMPSGLFPQEDTSKVLIALELPKHIVEHLKQLETATQGRITAKEAFEAAIVMGTPELTGFLAFIGAIHSR